jgi:alkanesulfonate monooxygenase SsuD/methylene tetrahydromethanopterin reductase-like flavin-dependent oxidoreductase (luciferase family)
LRFFLQSGNWAVQWPTIGQAVPEADRLGYWGFLMPDHYMWGPDRPLGDSTLETWTALTYLAARTEKIHLGTLVTPIPLRPPGMLAKEVSTLDLLSGGRTVLGVGAGWSQTEFEGYSVWDSPKVRVDKTREGLDLILKLWTTEGKVSHDGKHYTAREAVLDPKPVQKPHPPVLFGGVGKRMLGMAGEFADICCIPPWQGGDFGGAKATVIASAKRHSREGKVSFARLSFGFDEKYERGKLVEKVSKAAEEGCEYFIVGFGAKDYVESMRDFGKNVIPSF